MRCIAPKSSLVVVARAHALRSNPTESESALWRGLSGSQLGTPFRRQVPIVNFIADFAAPRERLIVEVDGPCHVRRRSADARRDRKLRVWGYRVLRLDSEQVLRDLPGALAQIRAALAE